jgi:hypothetical protein
MIQIFSLIILFHPYIINILSFSLLSDSLHQWSYYGKNDGYCLGIKKGNLINLLTGLKMEFTCGKVIYDKNIYEPLENKILDFLETFNPEKGPGLKAYIDHSVFLIMKIY